jgi:uncharacterized membrane protein
MLGRMRFTMAPVLLLLAACQPRGTEETAATPPAPAPAAAARVSDFSQPITARGNEPFWAVRIDGTRLVLLRPEAPDAVYVAPGARISPGVASWEAKAADGKLLKVTLYVSPCSDGMSDASYPMTAEVEAAGETLRGCAAKTAELPRGG